MIPSTDRTVLYFSFRFFFSVNDTILTQPEPKKEWLRQQHHMGEVQTDFHPCDAVLSTGIQVKPLPFCFSTFLPFSLFWIKLNYTDPAEFIQIVSQVQQSPSQKSSWVLKFLLFGFVFCFFSVWPLKKERKSNYGFFWRLTLSSAGLSESWTGLQETCTSVTRFFPSGVARGQRMCKTRIGSGKNSTCIKVVAANSLLFTVVHAMTNQTHQSIWLLDTIECFTLQSFSWVCSKHCLTGRCFCIFPGEFFKSIPWSQTRSALFQWINVFPLFCRGLPAGCSRQHTLLGVQTSLPRTALVAGPDRDSLNQFRAPFPSDCPSRGRVHEWPARNVPGQTETSNAARPEAPQFWAGWAFSPGGMSEGTQLLRPAPETTQPKPSPKQRRPGEGTRKVHRRHQWQPGREGSYQKAQ